MKAIIDIGYGHTKLFVNGTTMKFPTAIELKEDGDFDIFDNDKAINFEGKKYYVGEDVEKSINTRTFDFIMKYTPLFIYYGLKKMKIDINSIKELTFGLSIINWRDKERKNQYIEMLRKGFTVNNKDIKFSKIQPKVQGQGIFNTFSEKYKDTINGETFIIDIGYNTLDVLHFKNGKPNARNSFANTNGMNIIITHLQKYISNHYNLTNLSEQKTNEFLQQGYCKIDGEKIDLTHIIDSLVANYIDKLFNDVEAQLGDDAKLADYVVFSGGGAYYLDNIIKKHGNFYTTEGEHEFANVKGY